MLDYHLTLLGGPILLRKQTDLLWLSDIFPFEVFLPSTLLLVNSPLALSPLAVAGPELAPCCIQPTSSPPAPLRRPLAVAAIAVGSCYTITLLLNGEELSVRGWKSDNGFRGGYLQRIEEALKSGVSQDAALRCDANARGMRHKSWPLWDDWKVLFGKDRAVGTVAKDTFDAHANYAGRTPSSQQDVRLGSPVESGEYSAANPSPQQRPVANPNESTGQSIDHSLQTKKSGSKRKASSPPVGLIEMLGRMQDDTNERLDKLTNRIGFEFDLSEARKEVIDILSGVPDLTLVQQIDASEIIIDKVERVELFMRLPETSRLTYVMRVLEKHDHY
ncbi:hypothetical protein SASPL_101086 [Salvia splendens]|uniref:Uncharacterized protein n=1 Tax=Salvia splendens TaxID=180675 RepID=A0A8X8YTX2_SALSN|nr:hypothetical protein SASPL_101086 [Salvia splendens]